MTTRTINGRVVSLVAVPALDGFALQPLLAPAVGRAISVVIRFIGNDDAISLDSLSVGGVIGAFKSLPPGALGELASEAASVFSAIKPGDLKTVIRGLLYGGRTSIDGSPLWPVDGDDKRFNEMFAGRTRDLWEILFFAIQENYPDFFPATAGSGGPPKAGSPLNGSSTSSGDGQSTGSSAPAGSP